MADPCPLYFWGRYQNTKSVYMWHILFGVTWPDGYTWEDDLIPGPWPQVPTMQASYHSKMAMHQQLVVDSGVDTVRVDVTQSGKDRGLMRLGVLSAAQMDPRPGGLQLYEGDPMFPYLTLLIGNCDMWATTPDIYDYAYATKVWAHEKFTHYDLPDGRGRVELTPMGTAYWDEWWGWRILPEVYPEPQPRMLAAGGVDDAATAEAETAEAAGEPLNSTTSLPDPYAVPEVEQ